ncbi:MAG: dephospho-CoA kinase [Chitinophagales bacterium]|nr:dephospho-CoA kinase [Chitinophagales bacterium]
MLKIGITGGIGSGKSTVCKIFETLGIPVFYADEESKKILSTDVEVISEVKRIFGNEVFSNNIPDRKKISETVFNQPEKLKQLNSILHPAVIAKSETWFHSQKEKPYSIKEAALIYEIGAQAFLDKVIVVTAPEKIRIERIIKRDGITADEVQARLQNQMPEREKIAKADFIIVNDNEQLLIPQVLQIHEALTNKQV